jgi:hypothetical protein
MTPFRSISILLVLPLLGCGESQSLNLNAEAAPKSAHAVRATAPPPQSSDSIAFVDGSVRFVKESIPQDKRSTAASALGAMVTDGAVATVVGTQAGPAANAAAAPSVARKIIYDAQIDLVVESVEPVAKKVVRFVQDARGYVAEQNVTGSPGSLRSMHWRIRVPVDSFDSLVESILSLGELERNNRTSQDVTEQFYDIEARIKNKKVEEQTLNKILQERSGKLEDVLKIEIELSRVRGEIEQLEGKIRVLENLSSMATLTLNIREREKYTPPPPVAADFPTQISRTWNASFQSLVNVGKSLVLWAVNWVLWVPFLLVIVIVGWVVLRWLLRIFKQNLPALIALARTPITRPPGPASGP